MFARKGQVFSSQGGASVTIALPNFAIRGWVRGGPQDQGERIFVRCSITRFFSNPEIFFTTVPSTPRFRGHRFLWW